VQEEICYNCGIKAKKLSRDHIPPKSFFRPPLPTNLITVPCCKKCNESFSLDDEAFRLWAASSHGVSETGRWILLNKVVGSSFVRSPKLKAEVQKHLRMGNLRTQNQTISVPTISIPDERAEKFLFRTTRALLTHFYPDYDFSHDIFKARVFAPIKEHLAQARELAKLLIRDSRGDGVFHFWRGIEPKKRGGAWIFLFYDAACCQVLHGRFDSPSDTWD
jgi:hypothetical protein